MPRDRQRQEPRALSRLGPGRAFPWPTRSTSEPPPGTLLDRLPAPSVSTHTRGRPGSAPNASHRALLTHRPTDGACFGLRGPPQLDEPAPSVDRGREQGSRGAGHQALRKGQPPSAGRPGHTFVETAGKSGDLWTVKLRCDPGHWSCQPSVHGISQARILEWVAMSFSRKSSCVSCVIRRDTIT